MGRPSLDDGDAADRALTLLHWLLVDGHVVCPGRKRPATYGILRRLSVERNAKGRKFAEAKSRKAEAKKALEAKIKRLKDEFEAEHRDGAEDRRKATEDEEDGKGQAAGQGETGGDGQLGDGAEEGGGTGLA